MLGCGFGYANIIYVQGYTESAEGRMPGFRLRSNILRVLFYVTLAGMAASAILPLLGAAESED